MDHKVSKDMISSGMIPSGEKTQADLGRIQYGSAPSPNKLMDAYKSMYDKKEEVINEHHKKDADGNTIPHEDEELNEFVVTGTMAALKGLGAMATKLGAMAAKTGVKAATKFGGKGAANIVKNVARNPMGAIDNINRVGYAAQTVGNLMPKPSVPAVTKKQSQGGMVSADVDLFDIVKGQLLDEGYSEKEVNEIMVNLTEEQLEEFMKALATRAAQYGANIGREGSATGFLNQRADKKKVIDVINPKRKPFEPKSKPGESEFRAKSASDVVSAVSAAAKKPDTPKPTPTPRKKPSPEQKAIRKEITDKMNRPHQSVMKQIPVDKIRRRKGEVEQENADLFDIVKGKLLDEGLSEEEIKDIMLTLTPDEILNEITAEFALDASKKASAKSTMLGSQGDKQGMVDKAAQAKRLYDASAKKRREGNFKQGASAQGPSRIPTGEA